MRRSRPNIRPRKVDAPAFGVIRVEVHPRPATEMCVPVRIVSEMNLREHWAVAKKRKANHRQAGNLAVNLMFSKAPGMRDKGPFEVELTRIRGPRGRVLDDDNLQGGFKALRDGIADALQVNDGDKTRVRWVYSDEERGPEWAVRIRIERRES